ncbi:MAG: hypothetical protein EPN40_14235 [Rhodanobacteraceae bacterium]|nr:MAG: hypothetical protein EPN40_14235 [Rhodanobacteraceae bacterium]
MPIDSNTLSPVATVIAERIAGAHLRPALAWRIAILAATEEATGGQPDREGRKRLAERERAAGFTRCERVRLGIALGVYQLVIRTPGMAALAIACAAFWIVAAIVALVKLV